MKTGGENHAGWLALEGQMVFLEFFFLLLSSRMCQFVVVVDIDRIPYEYE